MSIHFEYSDYDKRLAEDLALGRSKLSSPGAELIRACISEDTLERFYARVYVPARALADAIKDRRYLTGQVMYIHGKTPVEDLKDHGLTLPLELIGMGEILVEGMSEFYDIPIPTLVLMSKVLSRWVDGHPRSVLLIHTPAETKKAVGVERASLVVCTETNAHLRLFHT